MNSRAALDALNFLLANVKDGLGPFLAVYLLASQHWDAGKIGVVMMIAGVATVVARAPAGALVDWTHWKRSLIVVASATVAAGALAMSSLPAFLPVTAAQTAIGVADAVFPPAVAAISLGIVGPGAFTRRIGRNEAFTHAGTASTAILAGVAGWLVAPDAVLWLVAALAVATVWAAMKIDPGAIDHVLARGAGTRGFFVLRRLFGESCVQSRVPAAAAGARPDLPQFIALVLLWAQDGQTVGEIGQKLFLQSNTSPQC